jgi:hypothetical protein
MYVCLICVDGYYIKLYTSKKQPLTIFHSGTSLRLAPSGNFLWAGFSDGTLRVFDLTGQFGLEQDAAVASRQKSTMMVASKWCQTFGAVACQIHARGVHTDLLTQVDVCDDYVFCGVTRGAMDLYAVRTTDLEANAAHPQKQNILDYLQVHVHSDAKLKGLGACTKLRTSGRPTYLLLTGKGIKNIHIWSFQPPLSGEEEPIWTQLYDTQTNGNTIHLLGFYRSPKTNKLLGISKSDTQKLRLWDLSAEEEKEEVKEKEERPKRPPYVDVANSQAALGLAAGGFCVCGGPTMYNQLSIVSLDQPNNDYNHTELALPSADKGMGSRRWQRRGDLKQVVNVASPPPGDANEGQMLLELDDGSIVQYSMSLKGASRLQVLQPPAVPALPDDYWKRTLCLASSKSTTCLVVAMSLYNPNTQKGQLVLRTLGGTEPAPPSPRQTDSSALQALCMEAPPPSALKRTKKKKKREDPKMKTKSSVDSSSAESSTDIKKKKKKTCAATTPKPNMSSDPAFQGTQKMKVVTPVQATPVVSKKLHKKLSSSSSLTGERIRVNKLKVIPISAQTNDTKKKQRGFETPIQAGENPIDRIRVNKLKVIPILAQKSDTKMKQLGFETPIQAGENPIDRIRVNKLKVIPISAHKNHDAKKKQLGFETPISVKKSNHSTTTTIVMNKNATSAQQVSPEAELEGKPAPPKPFREMMQQQQQGKQDKLESPPVPRKANQDDFITPQKSAKKAIKKKAKAADASTKSVPAAKTTNVAGKKRPRSPPTTRLDTAELANILVDMKSPNPKKKAVTPDTAPSREEVIAIRLRAQYTRIQGLLKELPPFQPAFLRKARSAPKTMEEAQAMARSKLAAQHRTSHELIRKRMLRAAQSTVRNTMDSYLSIEEARAELKGTVKSYQEVVYETLERQKLEASTLAAEQIRARSGLGVPTTKVSFPFQSTFRELEEIRFGIEAPRRQPGRPRAG